jgi:SAM-dependent methyltransferase
MIEQRKITEIATWDHLHAEGVESPRSDIYKSAELAFRYCERWVQSHSPGKVFLDLCCGNGRATIISAKASARLAIGIDISRVSIKQAINSAAHLSNARFIEGDCEHIALPDSSIDAAICDSSIQCLDFERALEELHRILVPGGACLIISSLAYNPFIAAYRKMTPEMRTRWSTKNTLSLKSLRIARRTFDVRNVRYWHLASLLSIPLVNTRMFLPVLKAANAADSVLTRIWPINLLSWMMSFELVKGSSHRFGARRSTLPSPR